MTSTQAAEPTHRTLPGTLTLLLSVGFFGALFIGMVILTHTVLTSQFPGHNDFLSRWEPARGFWLEGINPYSDQATENIQQVIYGRAALPGEDEGLFVYPFYTVFYVWPLVYLPYSWAAAIIMVVMEAALIAALLLLLSIVHWRAAPGVLVGMLLWTLFFYPAMRGLVLGQLGLLVYALEILALWALYKGQDRLAGAALALSTFKPQMGYLIVPFLLLWALRERRGRFLAGFAAVFGLLIAASFVLLPTWVADWFHQVQQYPDYTDVGSPVWVLANLTALEPGEVGGRWIVTNDIGQVIEPILTVGLYALLAWAWFIVLVQRRQERWLWTVTLTFIITHIVAPRTATPHFILFVLPLVFLSQHIRQTNRHAGAILLVLWLALLIVPWAQFFATVNGDFEHPTLFLPLPLFFFGWVIATYRVWWAKSPTLPQPSPKETSQ